MRPTRRADAVSLSKAMLEGDGVKVADIDDSKLKVAVDEYGASKGYNPKTPGAAEAVKADSKGGYGISAVIDFVGSEATFNFGASVLRKGGKQVIVGLFGGGMESPLPAFPMNSRAVQGSLVGSLSETREMLALIKEKGGVRVPPHQFRSIQEATALLRELSKGQTLGRYIMKHDWGGSGKL